MPHIITYLKIGIIGFILLASIIYIETAVAAQPRMLNLTPKATISNKPTITTVQPSCVKPGDRFRITGKDFGTSRGKGIALQSGELHIDVKIASWTNTVINAQIKSSQHLDPDRSFKIGIEKSDHSAWLSNLKSIKICKPPKLSASPGINTSPRSVDSSPSRSLDTQEEAPITTPLRDGRSLLDRALPPVPQVPLIKNKER